MKSLASGIGVVVALLGAVTVTQAQSWPVSNAALVAADTVPRPPGLEFLQPGVPVRASFALCGSDRVPATELTGTFVDLELGEAFQMEVVTDGRTQLHQVAIDDLLRIEVGTVRTATTRGTLYGALGGVALGVVGAAIGASGTSADAEYGSGAAIGGLLGAGLGGWLGSRSQTIEWRELPLYGPVYAD